MEHILDALAGKYIEPGPAGAPTAGMVDVLPTGRNFLALTLELCQVKVLGFWERIWQKK